MGKQVLQTGEDFGAQIQENFALFALDLLATKTADLSSLSVRPVNTSTGRFQPAGR